MQKSYKDPLICLLFSSLLFYGCALEREDSFFRPNTQGREEAAKDYSEAVNFYESLRPAGAPYYHPYYNDHDKNWYYQTD